MQDISSHVADRLIAYAAAHGADATRAMARPWGLTVAQVDTFCRENGTAIKRARLIALAQASAPGGPAKGRR